MAPIIDIHTHTLTEEFILGHGPWFTEGQAWFARGRTESAGYRFAMEGRPLPIEETYQHFTEDGVDKVVVVNMVAHCSTGRSTPNDFIAKYVQMFPDRFIGFGGVDPNMEPKFAVREVERCVKELGLRGLKFHPAFQQFWPHDDKQAYPIYEKCVELDIPVLFHTGTTRMINCKIRSSNPEYIDDVAQDFPELRIVMAHFGWPWVEEALAVAWRNPNVYIDLSGWLPKHILANSPVVFHYMNTMLPDRFVFGTDYPAIRARTWLQQMNEILAQGYDFGGKHREFRPGIKEKLLGENAMRVLKLEQPVKES